MPTTSDLVREAGRLTVRALTTATADLRPLPELMVIGVKRGGTTSLFRDLERHPAMCPLVPSARRLPLRENMKGVHYFDRDPKHSLRWYRGHFPTVATRAVRRHRAGAAFAAEASPYTFFHPLAADRVARACPATLLAVMLRDPVERTISHWAEQTRNGAEHLSLPDALAAETTRLGDDATLLASGTIAASHPHEQQSYATQSEYADSLLRWRASVGSDRLLVLFSEDYYRQPDATLRAVTDALGVAPFPRPDQGATATHRNAAPRPAVIGPDLERALVDRFAPDVVRIAEILGGAPPWPRFAGVCR